MLPAQKVELLRAACCVAGANGKCTENEKKVLARLADTVGVGQASFDAMIGRAESDTNFAAEQFRYLKNDPQECMSVLLQTAMADGRIEPAELTVLKTLSANLEVPEDAFTQLVDRTRSNLGNG